MEPVTMIVLAIGAGALAAGSRVGGIHAKNIRAENVVVGFSGDIDEKTAKFLVDMAEKLTQGGIHADTIEARNVVTGILRYIENPETATPEDLQKEMIDLQQNVKKAVAAGEIENRAEDLEKNLQEAKAELAKPQPEGSKVIRRLKTASEILNESAKTAQAAGNLQTQVIKLAPAGAFVYSVAKMLFGV